MATLLAAVAVLAGTSGSPAGALSPIRPDNAPTTVPGAGNGQLPGDLLRWVAPGCQIHAAAAPSLVAMLGDARAAGVALGPGDCYRDLAGQYAVRDYWCGRGHCEFAAVPGTSFHGWGKAVDFTDGGDELTFASAGFGWMRANAWRYGWNHPGWAEPDGAAPEPWHWEWVGDGGKLFPGMAYPTPTGSGVVLGGNPVGRLDAVIPDGPGRLRVSGWTIDPDVETATDVHVYIDSRFAGSASARDLRGDVGAVFPGYGARHGFSLPVEVVSGGHRLCVYAVNQGIGTTNPEMGCADLRISGDPVGTIDEVGVDSSPAGATVTVRGWAVDPDRAAPIEVHAYVDGAGVAVLRADGARPDLGAAYPRYGGAHGYRGTFPLGHGTHTLCLFGINVQDGSNSSIGCRTVVVDRNPIGSLDEVVAAPTPAGGVVALRGWALDPDLTGSTAVHVYVDGVGAAILDADGSRPDVAADYAEYGAGHGFGALVAVGPGVHRVCAFAINAGSGDANPGLGCRLVVLDRRPVGSFDEVTVAAGGVVTARGWAIDPDTAAPIEVHLYLDGIGVAILRADRARPDVGAVFPPYGPDHGFTGTVTVPAGRHQVCAFAIDVGSGGENPSLGCRTIQR